MISHLNNHEYYRQYYNLLTQRARYHPQYFGATLLPLEIWDLQISDLIERDAIYSHQWKFYPPLTTKIAFDDVKLWGKKHFVCYLSQTDVLDVCLSNHQHAIALFQGKFSNKTIQTCCNTLKLNDWVLDNFFQTFTIQKKKIFYRYNDNCRLECLGC